MDGFIEERQIIEWDATPLTACPTCHGAGFKTTLSQDMAITTADCVPCEGRGVQTHDVIPHSPHQSPQ